VVRDVPRVLEVVARMVGAVADASEEVIDRDRIYASSMVVAKKLLKPMVQMM